MTFLIVVRLLVPIPKYFWSYLGDIVAGTRLNIEVYVGGHSRKIKGHIGGHTRKFKGHIIGPTPRSTIAVTHHSQQSHETFTGHTQNKRSHPKNHGHSTEPPHTSNCAKLKRKQEP